MASAIEQSSSRRNEEQPEFNLREWGLKARIRHENTVSRRYSGSYIRNFRENTSSFRSNFTISSTASSPGCSLKGTSLVHLSCKIWFWIQFFIWNICILLLNSVFNLTTFASFLQMGSILLHIHSLQLLKVISKSVIQKLHCCLTFIRI